MLKMQKGDFHSTCLRNGIPLLILKIVDISDEKNVIDFMSRLSVLIVYYKVDGHTKTVDITSVLCRRDHIHLMISKTSLHFSDILPQITPWQ